MINVLQHGLKDNVIMGLGSLSGLLATKENPTGHMPSSM